MRDILAEVMASMKSNRMRIALTGFSIGWGIFILIVLMGAGNGLLKGMMANFSDNTDNIYTIVPGKTAMLHQGWPKNREIVFTRDDVEKLKTCFPDNIEHISATLSASADLSYGSVTTSGSIEGKEVGFERTEHIRIVEGRLLSQMDADSVRKTCLVSSSLAKILFRDEKHPVGKYVNGNGVQLLVVGIYEPNIDIGSIVREVYVPYTTVHQVFCPEEKLSKITLMLRGLDDMNSNQTFEKQLSQKIADIKDFNVKDPSAVKLKSDYENYLSTVSILDGIYIFIVIIGLATLVSGVVGVSNIMMITVKERTRELGVRKAMGASNEHIVALVIVESVIITLIFGYVGMICGVGITQLMSKALSAAGGSDIFSDPTVGLNIIFAANVVMLIAGIIAGYVPAKKAINSKLVDALSA
jgi:putative ABC transport system permease protein